MFTPCIAFTFGCWFGQLSGFAQSVLSNTVKITFQKISRLMGFSSSSSDRAKKLCYITTGIVTNAADITKETTGLNFSDRAETVKIEETFAKIGFYTLSNIFY